ncbi:MAG: TrkH family potassium uptake protein [Candidatus Bathyarchaeia archaeon]
MSELSRPSFLASLHVFGILLATFSLLLFLPAASSLLLGEADLAPFFLAPAILGSALGYALHRFTPSGELTLYQAMRLSAVSWAALPVLAMVPVKLAGGASWLNAYFEAMSGLTATGLTIFADVEALPRSLLLYRSLLEWFGGVGVIVLFLSVLARPGVLATKLYLSEARREKIRPSVVGTVRRIWWIYALYTALGIILFHLSGMPLFDAINHSMTAIATGGFSTRNSSLAFYGGPLVEAIAILMMALGGISFGVHYGLLVRMENPLHNPEVRAMLTILALFVPSIAAYLLASSSMGALDAIRFSLFESVSALSGTGFTIAPLYEQTKPYGGFTKFLLTILMLIGGGYGSTSSAIKLFRLVVVFKYIRWAFRRELFPSIVFPLRFREREIEGEEILEAFRLILLYLGSLAICTAILTAFGFDIGDSLFECASAQGNVGLSVGITSGSLPPIPKLVLIFEMWIGRLEIIPVLVLMRGLRDAIRRETLPMP